jgi:magnesium transporter
MAKAVKDPRSTVWLDVIDIDDSDIDVLTNVFNLHPLTIEDSIMPSARPKIEEFPEYLFLVIFSLYSANSPQNIKINMAEMNCCLGHNFLITFHSNASSTINVCKDRVRKQSPTIMHGADMLLYSILDSCVDNYFPIINEFDNTVDAVSDELFQSPDQDTLKKLYTLKNDIMNLRRTIGPQSDIISLLLRGSFKMVQPANLIYYRNVYDNMVRFNDTVGALRDIISGAMEAHASIVSNRLNEVMKTLTVITTIMMPLTLIASIYGMNFKYMPGLNHVHGYYITMAIMVALTGLMLIYFKRKKWL